MDLQTISSGLLRRRSCGLVICLAVWMCKVCGHIPGEAEVRGPTSTRLIWPLLMRAQTKSDVCLRTWGLFSSLHSTFLRITRSDMMAFSPGFFRWNEMHTAAFKCAIRHWYMRAARTVRRAYGTQHCLWVHGFTSRARCVCATICDFGPSGLEL